MGLCKLGLCFLLVLAFSLSVETLGPEPVRDHRIALIVPIHPPKEDWAVRFFESYERYGKDTFRLYFLFSIKEHLDISFMTKRNKCIEYDCIMMDRRRYNESNPLTQVTYKKFYGISEVCSKHEFAVTIDGDSLFFRCVS